MAEPSAAPVRYPVYNQPPSYEECMGSQPPRYPHQSVGGMHPPPQPHAYVADTGLSEYERAKREKKKRILTIGLVLTLCTLFMFIVLYIRLDLYHESQKRHMQNHFRIQNIPAEMENSPWSSIPKRTYSNEYSQLHVERISDEEMANIQKQLNRFWDSVSTLDFKNEYVPTGSILETETTSYDEITNESPAIGLVNGTSD